VLSDKGNARRQWDVAGPEQRDAYKSTGSCQCCCRNATQWQQDKLIAVRSCYFRSWQRKRHGSLCTITRTKTNTILQTIAGQKHPQHSTQTDWNFSKLTKRKQNENILEHTEAHASKCKKMVDANLLLLIYTAWVTVRMGKPCISVCTAAIRKTQPGHPSVVNVVTTSES